MSKNDENIGLVAVDNFSNFAHIAVIKNKQPDEIIRGLKEIIDTYKPDCVSIEKVFVNVNPHTTLLLGQARGAAISVSVLNDLDVYEYTALQIKKSVVGNGHAAKEQVQMMVKKLLDLPALTSKDSADALACAICHANISQALQNFNVGTRMKGGRFVWLGKLKDLL